ncbi:MAG: hypothetical protein GXX79_03660 [Actinomycetales bacterium]|nr:hypothetical protein [Actinomycetales bacterium]
MAPAFGEGLDAQRGQELDVRLPDEPPPLSPGAARALLRLLLAEAGARRVPTPAEPQRLNGHRRDRRKDGEHG